LIKDGFPGTFAALASGGGNINKAPLSDFLQYNTGLSVGCRIEITIHFWQFFSLLQVRIACGEASG